MPRHRPESSGNGLIWLSVERSLSTFLSTDGRRDGRRMLSVGYRGETPLAIIPATLAPRSRQDFFSEIGRGSALTPDSTKLIIDIDGSHTQERQRKNDPSPAPSRPLSDEKPWPFLENFKMGGPT